MNDKDKRIKELEEEKLRLERYIAGIDKEVKEIIELGSKLGKRRSTHGVVYIKDGIKSLRE